MSRQENKETKIKICGLKRQEDIAYANELRPDYIGFVFLEGRKRYVSPDLAKELRGKLDPSIKAVGVFVDAPVELVIKLLQENTIQMAQLHGHEDEAYMATLREACDAPIIKAFVMKSPEDVEKAVQSTADYLLLDGGLGAGETFDWTYLKMVQERTHKPIFLAGGMGPDNVGQAIETLHPFAVDGSSSMETADVKDYAKMKAFVEAVRNR